MTVVVSGNVENAKGLPAFAMRHQLLLLGAFSNNAYVMTVVVSGNVENAKGLPAFAMRHQLLLLGAFSNIFH